MRIPLLFDPALSHRGVVGSGCGGEERGRQPRGGVEMEESWAATTIEIGEKTVVGVGRALDLDDG